MSTKNCIVIDGHLSTGSYFIQQLAELGFVITHIQQSEINKPIDNTVRELLSQNIIYDNNFSILLNKIRAINPDFVFAAYEGGIDLADKINNALDINSNDYRFTNERRNKYLMIELLKSKSLLVPDQIIANKLEDILEWSSKINNFPIVIKPIASAGTQGVRFCYSSGEIKEAFKAIFLKRNVFGHITNEVVAQTKLKGQQYLINTISENGMHWVTDIWKDDRIEVKGGAFNCDRLMLNRNFEKEALITSYIKKVLDTLGIKNGPASADLMFTNQGPALIEISPKLMGGFDPDAFDMVLGERRNHVSLTVDFYGNKKMFLRKMNEKEQPNCHFMEVALISNKSGIITDTNGLEKIKTLDSFHSFYKKPKIGDKLKKTLDFLSHPGFVYLVHKDLRILEKDYKIIRELEKDNELYKIK